MSALAAELAAIEPGRRRLNRRARRVLDDLGDKPTVSIPGACGGWDETRAAYRLFDHAEVTAEAVLAPHIACTEARLREHPRVLCIQDTTELDYTNKKGIAGLGPLNYESRWGLYLHPTLAVTPDRVPLGLLDLYSWAREPGSLGQDKDPNRPLEEKESVRWVDGFARVNELAERLHRHPPDLHRRPRRRHLRSVRRGPLSRARRRLAGARAAQRSLLADGRKLRAVLDAAPVLTEITFDRPAANGRTRAHRPPTDQGRARDPEGARAPRSHAWPTSPSPRCSPPSPTRPPGEDPLDWLLLTNLPVETPEQAIEKLQWYLCRWQIEIYFKVLKSGCRIEELQLEKRERLEPALAFYMIIAWRVLYLTMLGRECPEMPCDTVFADEEWQAVYLVTQRKPPPEQPPSLDTMVRMVAGLGGFLNRKSDGFPGPKTLWIGLQRAADFVLALDAQRSIGESYATARCRAVATLRRGNGRRASLNVGAGKQRRRHPRPSIRAVRAIKIGWSGKLGACSMAIPRRRQPRPTNARFGFHPRTSIANSPSALIIVPATPAKPPAEQGRLAGVLGVVSVRAGEADRGFGRASRTSALARARRSVRRRWFRQVGG